MPPTVNCKYITACSLFSLTTLKLRTHDQEKMKTSIDTVVAKSNLQK